MAPRRKMDSILSPAHPASLDPALDLFSSPIRNDVYLDSSYVEHKPLNTLASSSHIDFQISGRGNDLYHDVRHIYIRSWLKIVDNTGAALPSGANDPKVCMQCGGISAAIESTTFQLNNTNITPESQNYSMTSFMMNVLVMDEQSIANRGGSEMFILDNGATPKTFTSTNTGAQARYNMTKDATVNESWTKLMLDISTMPRLLPSGIDMFLRLNLYQNAARYLFADANLPSGTSAKLQILDMSLYVKEVKLSPALLLEHARLFAQGPAILPYKRIVMREFVIPANVTTFHIENISLGKIPCFMVAGMTNTAVDLLESRFAFRHYDIVSITAEVPGKTIRYDQMKWDAGKETYSQAFNNMFIALGLHRSQESMLINYENFKRGLCLFLFDLSCEQTGLQFAPVNTHDGPLRLSGEFKGASTAAISVNLMLVYDSTISINADREVVLLD